MIVISDTTPLISLLKIDRLDLLNSLFGEVIIPEAVFQELVSNENFLAETDRIKSCKFIKTEKISDRAEINLIQAQTGLDLGESEAISVARNYCADILLMDEVKGRFVAKQLGLNIMGTVGILKASFDEGFVTRSELESYVNTLRMSHRHISQKLFDWLMSNTK